MGVAVVMDPETADPLRCRGGVGTIGWPGSYGSWWQADPNDRSVLIFLAHNMAALDQMARGIGLGVWSAIGRFHETCKGVIAPPGPFTRAARPRDHRAWVASGVVARVENTSKGRSDSDNLEERCRDGRIREPGGGIPVNEREGPVHGAEGTDRFERCRIPAPRIDLSVSGFDYRGATGVVALPHHHRAVRRSHTDWPQQDGVDHRINRRRDAEGHREQEDGHPGDALAP